MTDSRKELLAELAHVVWAEWMAWQEKHVHLVPRLPYQEQNRDAIDRWKRQAATPYEQLPDAEKASDRAIAERYLYIIDHKRLKK